MRFAKLPISIAFGGTTVINGDFCSTSSNQQGVISKADDRTLNFSYPESDEE